MKPPVYVFTAEVIVHHRGELLLLPLAFPSNKITFATYLPDPHSWTNVLALFVKAPLFRRRHTLLSLRFNRSSDSSADLQG